MIKTAKEARDILQAANAEKSSQWAKETFENLMLLIEEKSRLGYISMYVTDPISTDVVLLLEQAGFTYSEKIESLSFEFKISWLL
jgi:hypothetical protein